jgi:hypothetical protein
MSIIEYIKDNNLTWQPSFNKPLNDELFGYRGALIIEDGKELSKDRKLPPKIQAKQVILVSNESKIEFFACELDSFNDFKPLFEKYKDFFDKDGINILYVTDLEVDATFEYEGVTFTAFMLDESSVWNELLELADLEKSDMKRIKSNEEKILTLYEELKDSDIEESKKSFEDILENFVGESSKQLMGAV